jgi:hypothetical protein
MAKERKVPDFTSDQLQQVDAIKRQVLSDSPAKAADEPKPTPRPMLPNFYYRGGRVDVSPKNYFAKGGAQLPRKGVESRKP